MKSGIIITIMIILAVGGGILAFLYSGQAGILKNVQSQIASLQADVTALKGSNTSSSNIQTQITTLQSDVVALKTAAGNTQPLIQGSGNGVIDLVPKLEPAVVRIDVAGSGFTASGSGFIIDSTGYIMTNQHVIDSTTSINVTLKNGQQYSATVISSDANLDLAIIKLNGNFSNLTVVPLGSASDIIVGEDVVAVGFPLGQDLPGPASFTRGIVSAIRTVSTDNYIQTDVTINPGSSGGILANMSGKVIGVTSAGIVPPRIDAENVGLAIPVDVFQPYIQANLK